ELLCACRCMDRRGLVVPLAMKFGSGRNSNKHVEGGRIVYTEYVSSVTLSPPTISPLPTRRDYCRLPGCATLNPSREAPMLDRVSAVIRLHENDNVVVARAELLPGAGVEGGNVTARDIIPAGHKVATAPIAPGEPVRKYNQIIGFASQPVEPG